DIAHAVAGVWAVPVDTCELSLEKLPAPPDRAEGIAMDDVIRGIRREPVAAPGADFVGQRLVDSLIRHIRGFRFIVKLSRRRRHTCQTRRYYPDAMLFFCNHSHEKSS